MAGVMEDSFHLRCFLRSLWSWWADISLWSMKLMVGGMLGKRDCFSAGESVSVGFWEICNERIVLFLVLLLADPLVSDLVIGQGATIACCGHRADSQSNKSKTPD